MNPTISIHVPLLPKQLEFVLSTAKETLYSGAFGAGKSRALCFAALSRAVRPGNLVGLTRKTRTALARTTLRTLLLPDGNLPAVLPGGAYTHRASESRIQIHGGGEILYFGCDQPEVVASMNLGDCCIDEASELDSDEYTMLLGRVRSTASERRQTFGATNPASPSHFLFERFFHARPEHNRLLIQTHSAENTFLPPDYLSTLDQFTGAARDRYVLGQWCNFEGLVYGNLWRRATHIVHTPPQTVWRRIVVGVDVGYTNPSVALKWGIDGDGRMHLLDEWYHAQRLDEDLIDAILPWRPSFVVVDPSAAACIAKLRQRGLDVRAGLNKVAGGIKAVMGMLAVAKDGRPRLTVEPHCENWIREVESYVWARGTKDEPVKLLDHAMDATRYAVAELTKPASGVIPIP